MKNLIILLMFVGVCLTASGQNNATYDAKVNYGTTFHYYTADPDNSVDTLGIADTVWMYTYWHLNTAHFANYTQIKLDSLTGSPDSVFVLFQTRINKFDTWTTDSTIVWMGTSADTVITYNEITKRAFPYRRVKVIDQVSTFKIGVNQLRQLFLK